MRGARALPLLLVLGLSADVGAAGSRLDRNIYRSDEYEVEVSFPISTGEQTLQWAVSELASYPEVMLVTAVERKRGGKITLAVDHLRHGERLGDCVERNRALMGKLGFKISRRERGDVLEPSQQPATGAYIMQVAAPDGRYLIKQAYRQLDPGSDVVFVITLAAPRETLQTYVRPFDDTVRSMTRRKKSAPTATAPTTTPATPSPPGSEPAPEGVDRP
jgi:hypothetical protein